MILGVTPHKGDSFNGRFSEPLPFAFVFEALPQNCLGSCRFECFMFAGHEAVIHIEICAASEKLRTATCSRHMVNLCVLRLLSSKGRRGGGMGPMPRSVPESHKNTLRKPSRSSVLVHNCVGPPLRICAKVCTL